MKIFVSGKFDDKNLIKIKIRELKLLGYEITYDWTSANLSAANSAVVDINGVRDCDVHIIIITDSKYIYRGTFTELGCSLGLNKRILIFCPFEKAYCMSVPFYYHPSIMHYDKWNDLLIELSNL